METSGPDRLHGFWLKKFTSLHQAIVKHLDDYFQIGDVLNWMVGSRTVLIQKDVRKRNTVGNYRPIVFLNLLWKLLTGIVNDKVYDHLNEQNLLPEEQKGCRGRTRGKKRWALNPIFCHINLNNSINLIFSDFKFYRFRNILAKFGRSSRGQFGARTFLWKNFSKCFVL